MSTLKIAVLSSSWMVVGKMTREDDFYVMTDAAIIRRWGTKDGLGELAMKSELPETKLDNTTRIMFHVDKLIMTLDCTEEAWKAWHEKRKTLPQ